MLLMDGYITFIREDVVSEICRDNEKTGKFVKNKENIKIGKDMLAPLGLLLVGFTKVISEAEGFLIVFLKQSDTASIASDVDTSITIATWVIWVTLMSLFILPNYYYYVKLNYLIDKDKESQNNSNCYNVRVKII